MLLFPLLFPNGDLDLAGENGEADANGEVDPAKASNPDRLVAVTGVAGCGGVRDDVNAANDDRLNGDVKEAWIGVVSRGNETCFVDGDVSFWVLGGALEKTFCPLTEANGDAVEAYDMNPPYNKLSGHDMARYNRKTHGFRCRCLRGWGWR